MNNPSQPLELLSGTVYDRATSMRIRDVPRQVLLIAAFLAAILICMGVVFSGKARRSRDVQIDITATPPATTPSPLSDLSSPADIFDGDESGPPSLSRRIEGMKANDDPDSRLMGRAAELGLLDFAAAVKVLEERYAGHELEERKSDLLATLADENRATLAQGLALIKDSTIRQKTAATVLSGWARRDPTAVAKFARVHLTGASRTSALRNAASAFINNGSLSEAMKLADEISSSNERTQVLSELARAKVQQDVMGTVDWIHSLPSAAEHAPLEQAILMGLSNTLPVDQLVDLSNVLVDVNARTTCGAAVARRLAEVDATNAIAWVESLPNDVRPRVEDYICGVIASTDVAKATELAVGRPGTSPTGALRSISRVLTPNDPVEATKWYDGLPMNVRIDFAPYFVSDMYREDASAAIAWATGLQQADERDAALLSLTNSTTRSDRATALACAHRIANSELRRKVLERMGEE